jgi:hypothetical protein
VALLELEPESPLVQVGPISVGPVLVVLVDLAAPLGDLRACFPAPLKSARAAIERK